MWHTTELIGAFKDITNRYGYGIYQNRKLSVAVCNDLLAEYDTEKNIVQMLFQAGLGETFIGVPYKNEQELKIGLSRVEKFLMDQAIESGVREGILDVVMDPMTNPVVAPVYTSSDIREYSDGLHKEILYLKQGKGKRYKIVNGSKLNKSDNGVYTYSFEMETEIHLPDDAPVVVELSGGVRAVGTVLSCEDFQLMLMLDRDIGDRVGSARMMVEPWKLLEALDKRMNSLNPNVNKLAIRLMEEGPKLTSSKDINKVPKGQEAAIKMLQQEDIVSIWGPPGTGKTHTMAEIAKDYIYQGKSVLIVSHSNVSVDGVIKQIIKNPDDRMKDYLKHGKILRFGYVRDNELAKHPYATSFTYTLSMCNSYATELDRLLIQRDDFRVKNKTHTDEYNKLELKIKQLRSDIRKEERRYVDKAQLIGTTISRATVDPMFEQRQFDLVMFDEVSMAYVPQVIAAAALARDKFLFVGDFRQLAPISQNPSAKILQVDIFSFLKIVGANGDMYYHPWLVMLNEQRRMYPEIAALPKRWQEYCVETENATFPLIVIDDEIAWYGLPTAKWVFKVNKTDSLVTVVNAMVRIKGRNTIEMMKALTDLEVVEIGENKRPLTKKKGMYTAQEVDDSNDTKVKVPGLCGLSAFVEEKEFCPNCRKNMILTKGSKGTSYLRCSDKSCLGRKYLTPDLINWYISAKNVSCPRHDGGGLKGGLSKFGPYIKCSCGHYLKPDEI